MKNDEKIKTLLLEIELKEKTLVKPKVNWKTNAIYRYDGKYININIANYNDIIEACSTLINTDETLSKVVNTLDIPSECIQDLVSLNCDYLEDFKTRVAIIKYNSKKSELDKLKNTLKQLVSEEARTEMEIEKIEALLKI